jgi:FtsZ-binding cell division protein ZapB
MSNIDPERIQNLQLEIQELRQEKYSWENLYQDMENKADKDKALLEDRIKFYQNNLDSLKRDFKDQQ